MITSLTAVAALGLGASLIGLLVVGARWKQAHAALLVGYLGVVLAPAYVVGDQVWRLPRTHLWAGLGLVAICAVAVGSWERDWNAPSHVFLGSLVATSAGFVGLGTEFAFWTGLGPIAAVGSGLLVALEAFAFVLLAISTHEVLNVVGRVKWRRRTEGITNPGEQPFVSIHVATHNEPPELVLDTLRSLTALHYDRYEVIVLDNNTEDPELWRPLEEFCHRSNLRFVHLENWPGYKAGALNHGLQITDERAEIIAVVDADFVVEPNFLERTVGYFGDPKVGIVQTRQDFVTDANVPYLRRLALTYRTFDEVTMPSRNEDNAIIFAGTMGLLRRRAVAQAGGWAEWCVTEDAELSLRILGSGYTGVYVDRAFGRGVMPLTFAGLKRQRFRWCFGGIQMLRAHWRLLVSGKERRIGAPRLRLTRRQRFSYLAASLQWFQALLTLMFSGLLALAAASRIASVDLEIRPLVGVFVAVPFLLLVSGLTKAVWGLRARLAVGVADVVSVIAIWLALTWAVALGCLHGLSGRRLPFFRTPKFKRRESLRQVISSTRTETPLALILTGAAVAVAATAPPSPQTAFLIALCGWGALVFWCAPLVALAATRADLHSGALRRRRYLESIRDRTSTYRRPLAYGVAVTGTAVALLLLIGGSTSIGPEAPRADDLFTLPEREPSNNARGGEQRVAEPAPGARQPEGAQDEPVSGRQPVLASGPARPDGNASTNVNAPNSAGDGRAGAPGQDTAPGQSVPPGQDASGDQPNDGPAPQASDAPGQQPNTDSDPGADPTPPSQSKASPKPRPTPKGNGSGKG